MVSGRIFWIAGSSGEITVSQKYGRTYHYPFSPGTTSDDRIQHDYWRYLQEIPQRARADGFPLDAQLETGPLKP
ncbi:hypothetical protein CCY01nite_42460 [Chitinophaga cymbidii]|uniref:Uncharacterized protein n=1 Tax=Chitinophaga cymbidii TaxID=1096750 RepID=A0A512RQL2_9BACT|nr:hypothetical protein CCY01nite_42460 [Chitinophaga cymbidii]